MQILVINRVRVLRVLGRGPHTPAQFFWEYPPPPTTWEVKHVRSAIDMIKPSLEGNSSIKGTEVLILPFRG